MNYVFTDIHGNLKLFEKIETFLKRTNSHAFFLGDACDRGPDGYIIMKRLLEDQTHFTYLKGNHEDLFVKMALDEKDDEEDEELVEEETFWISDAAALYFLNGGEPTYSAWIKDGAPMDIVEKLNQLPLFAQYGKYDLCHAGCRISDWGNKNNRDLLWSRDHFEEPWTEGRILIHGHTSVDKNGGNSVPLFYQNNSKINLDVRTVRNKKVYLFGLDDGSLITFEEEEKCG